MYRHLTPYGKIVVIKSLALSKLSHIALVVPSLAKKELKTLETLLLSFLWSNKSHTISKEDSYKPFNQGGLGTVDIFTFWQSLKCSWVKRILSTDAFFMFWYFYWVPEVIYIIIDSNIVNGCFQVIGHLSVVL